MYNPLIHKKQTRRLNGHDYASENLYFITIKTQNNNPLFGEIRDRIMHLNAAGAVAEKCWLSIPEHFPHAAIREYVIMPDHIHGIIEIVYNPHSVNPVGANPVNTGRPYRICNRFSNPHQKPLVRLFADLK